MPKQLDVVLPVEAEGNRHVWHLYVVRVPDRDEVPRHARAHGVGASVHYPTPVHLTPAMAEFGTGRGSMPVSERAAISASALIVTGGGVESRQS